MYCATYDIKTIKMEKETDKKKIIGAVVGLFVLLVFAILMLSQGSSYEVSFDTSGGSEIEAQKVSEGKRAKRPDNPKKEGYEFVLWENDGVRYDFDEKVTGDITLKASWKQAVIKYKVTFELEGKEETYELENLTDDILGYLKFEDKEGYEIRWYVDDQEYDFTTPLTADLKLKGEYVQTSSYTITFDSDGGSKVDSQKIGVGEKAKEPKEPTKKGFIFDGWYYNNTKFDFDGTVKRNMKLVAHWKEDPNVKRFKVKFDSDGGTAIPEQTVIDGDKVAKPTNPTKKGFVFVDWTLNGTVYNFGRAVTADMELKATWREAAVYKVTFDPDNGTATTVQEVEEGSKVKAPTTAPKKDGFVFIEWRLNNKKYDFNAVVTKDITLKAYWEKEVTYTLTYDPNGGSVTPTSKTLKKGEQYGTLPTPTRAEYTFNGWYTAKEGGTVVAPSTLITNNTTIYARWVKNPVAVTSVRLNKTTLSLTTGGTETLTATVTPNDATDKTITWTSSKTNVATVNSNGLVTAMGAGTTTITATSKNGKTATCTVTVTAPVVVVDVQSIRLNKTSTTLTIGGSETLTVTFTPTNATNKSITWKSSNTGAATVDQNGKVTAVSAGTATITATSNNGKTATCTVTVKAPDVAVTGVTLNKPTLTLTVGGSETLSATVSPSNATNKTVTWSSSNNSVAEVNSSGKVTAKAAGTATITATSNNGKTATCTVTVNPAAPTYRVVATKLQSGSASASTDLRLKVTANDSAVTFRKIEYTDGYELCTSINNGSECIVMAGDIADDDDYKVVLSNGTTVTAHIKRDY